MRWVTLLVLTTQVEKAAAWCKDALLHDSAVIYSLPSGPELCAGHLPTAYSVACPLQNLSDDEKAPDVSQRSVKKCAVNTLHVSDVADHTVTGQEGGHTKTVNPVWTRSSGFYLNLQPPC